jgi:hypothetical protein
MGFAGKLELCGGIATCLLGVATSAYVVYEDYETAHRLNNTYSLLLAVAVVLMLFIAPCLLVMIGSYFHAVMREPLWGRAMLVAGSLFLALPLFIMSTIRGYQDITVIRLCQFMVLSAILTVIISLFVRVEK